MAEMSSHPVLAGGVTVASLVGGYVTGCTTGRTFHGADLADGRLADGCARGGVGGGRGAAVRYVRPATEAARSRLLPVLVLLDGGDLRVVPG